MMNAVAGGRLFVMRGGGQPRKFRFFCRTTNVMVSTMVSAMVCRKTVHGRLWVDHLDARSQFCCADHLMVFRI